MTKKMETAVRVQITTKTIQVKLRINDFRRDMKKMTYLVLFRNYSRRNSYQKTETAVSFQIPSETIHVKLCINDFRSDMDHNVFSSHVWKSLKKEKF